MRAIVVNQIGGPEVLQMADCPQPIPGEHDLLVTVGAAGLNFIDTYQRSGLYPMTLPFVPGLEGAGTVVGVGSGVRDFRIGDRVGWVSAQGSYAEVVVVPADRAAPLPDSLDIGMAAAVLLQGITAHYLTTDTFPLGPGDSCVIHAAAGGVGLLLTQIAKRKGATVYATAGTIEKADLASDAGADHVVVYSSQDFKDAIEEIAGPNSIDVVYDGVGATTFEKGLDLLRPRGMMVSYGNASGPPPAISPLSLSRKGSLFLTRPTMYHYLASRPELMTRVSEVFSWVQDGSLRVRVWAEFPLDEAAEAHQALEARLTTGKVLLRP